MLRKEESGSQEHPSDSIEQHQRSIEISYFLELLTSPSDEPELTEQEKESFLYDPISPALELKLDYYSKYSLSKDFLFLTYKAANIYSQEKLFPFFKEMKTLLLSGANINYLSAPFNEERGFSSLHIAAVFANSILIEFLLLNGADPQLPIINPPKSSSHSDFDDEGDDNDTSIFNELFAPWNSGTGLSVGETDRKLTDNFHHLVTAEKLYSDHSSAGSFLTLVSRAKARPLIKGIGSTLKTIGFFPAPIQQLITAYSIPTEILEESESDKLIKNYFIKKP